MIKALALAAALLAGLTLAPAAPAAEAPWPGARFSVEVRGNGPDVILIPGLASSRSVWDETARRLERTHRVHLVQVAGFAGEPVGANANEPLVPALVDDLARYVRDRKLVRNAVIGHSMGGKTGVALAARHPDAVERVLVVDSLPFFSLLFDPAATPDKVRPQADMFRDATLRMTDAQYEATQTATVTNLVKTEGRRAEVVRWSIASDRGATARAVHELMTTDIRSELPRVKANVTVLYAWDAAAPWTTAQADAVYANAYAALPGVKLIRIDGAYHFLMWDQAERFDAEVDTFLR